MTATLVVKSGITDKQEYALAPGKPYFIGRSREADVVVKDQQASRRHAAIEATPDGTWTIADQDSSNGTYVNRQRTKTRVLRDGDLVQIGKTTFEVHIAGAPAEPEPEPKPKPPQEGTLIVGRNGDLHAKGTDKIEPPREPSPAEPLAFAPGEPAADAEPERHVPAKQEADDEDLQKLFAFLDKLEDGERPADDADPPAGDSRSVPHEPPPVTPRPTKPTERDGDGGAHFDLLDKAEPIPKDDGPEPEPPKKGGGLLGFLRHKKKKDT